MGGSFGAKSGALVAEYVTVLYENSFGALYPSSDEYTSKFLRKLYEKKVVTEWRAPKSSDVTC